MVETSFFKNIDIFRIKPKIYIQKQENINSCLGMILTIFFSLISFVFLGFNFFQTFQRLHYTNSYNLETKQEYNLPTSKYPFFLRFLNKNGQAIQNLEKIIKIEAYYKPFEDDYKKSLDDIFVSKETILDNCNINEISEIENLLTENITNFLLNFKCAIPINDFNKKNNNNDSIYLETYNFQGYKFSKCSNNTKSNIICLDEKTIDSEIDDMTFIWAHIDYDIFHNKIVNPFQPKIIKEVYYFNSKKIKRFSVRKKQVIYNDENGYISESYQEYINYLYDSTDILILDSSPLYPYLFSMIYIDSSGKRDIHFRRYKKLIESLTESFAFIKTMQACCIIFVGLLHEKVYFQNLINAIFKFDFKEIENTDISKYQVKFMQMKDEFIYFKENKFYITEKNNEIKNNKQYFFIPIGNTNILIKAEKYLIAGVTDGLF